MYLKPKSPLPRSVIHYKLSLLKKNGFEVRSSEHVGSFTILFLFHPRGFELTFRYSSNGWLYIS